MFLDKFFGSKSTQNGLKREKKQKKNFQGRWRRWGPKFFPQKHHYMQKFSLIGPAISSGTPPAPPHHETCIVVQPL